MSDHGRPDSVGEADSEPEALNAQASLCLQDSSSGSLKIKSRSCKEGSDYVHCEGRPPALPRLRLFGPDARDLCLHLCASKIDLKDNVVVYNFISIRDHNK